MVVFICEWNHMQFSLGLLKQVADMCIYIISHICTYINTGWGKSMFTVVSMRNVVYSLLIIVLFSIQTTVNILLPFPVFQTSFNSRSGVSSF